MRNALKVEAKAGNQHNRLRQTPSPLPQAFPTVSDPSHTERTRSISLEGAAGYSRAGLWKGHRSPSTSVQGPASSRGIEPSYNPTQTVNQSSPETPSAIGTVAQLGTVPSYAEAK